MSGSLERKITAASLLKFAMPTIIMMVVLSLYTVVDGIFVARLIGTTAFSAVNIVFPLVSIIIALGTMFGAGVTAIVSKKIGEGDGEGARQIMTFILIFTIVLGAVIAAVLLLALNPLIYLLGADDAIFPYAKAYSFILILFFPFGIIQMQFQNLLIANGKPQLGLITTIAGGVANIVLDYLFIAVFNMGIGGAALATGIGMAIPSIFGLIYFSVNKKGNIYFAAPKKAFRWLWRAMSNGSSEMVSNLSSSVTTILFNLLLMKYIGEDGVAAISVLLYLDFVLVAVSLGYAMGISPLIGYNYGMENEKRLKRIYKSSLLFCAIVGLVITVMTFFFADILASAFSKPGTQVHDLASHGLRIYAFGYLFKGFNIFASALFTSFSNGKVSAVLSLMRTLVFLAGSILLLSAIFGVEGIWYASLVAETLAMGFSVVLVLKYKKKYKY